MSYNPITTASTGTSNQFYQIWPDIPLYQQYIKANFLDTNGYCHEFYFDPAQKLWISMETSAVNLSVDMANKLQSGVAVLNWENQILEYREPYNPPLNMASAFGGPKRKPTPNKDWLMNELEEVCAVGRELLLSA